MSRICKGSAQDLYEARHRVPKDKLWMLSVAINRKLGYTIQNPAADGYLLDLEEKKNRNKRKRSEVEVFLILLDVVPHPAQIFKPRRYCANNYGALSYERKRNMWLHAVLQETPRELNHDDFLSPAQRVHQHSKLFGINITHQQAFAFASEYYLSMTHGTDTSDRRRVLSMIQDRAAFDLNMISQYDKVSPELPVVPSTRCLVREIVSNTKLYNKTHTINANANICLSPENIDKYFQPHTKTVFRFLEGNVEMKTVVKELPDHLVKILCNSIIYRTQLLPDIKHLFNDCKQSIYFTLCMSCFSLNNVHTYCDQCIRFGSARLTCMHPHKRERRGNIRINTDTQTIECNCRPGVPVATYPVHNRVVYIPYLDVTLCACHLCNKVYVHKLAQQEYNKCPSCTTTSPPARCLYATFFRPHDKHFPALNAVNFAGSDFFLCHNHNAYHTHSSRTEKFVFEEFASKNVVCHKQYGTFANGYAPPRLPGW